MHKSVMDFKIFSRGDVLAIITPSWCGPNFFPIRLYAGILAIQAIGLTPRLSILSLANRNGGEIGTAKERALEINLAFRDTKVRGIIASIGGESACDILPWLDFDLIRKNPKPLLGFSDISVLHMAIFCKTNQVSYVTPMVMTSFADHVLKNKDESVTFFEEFFFQEYSSRRILEAKEYSVERLEWGNSEELFQNYRYVKNLGILWIRGGTAEGVLIGGCIESLVNILGSDYFPSMTGKILFLESSAEEIDCNKLRRNLEKFINCDGFDGLNGIIFGKFLTTSNKVIEDVCDTILDVFSETDFPIVIGLDTGHSKPIFSLPIGEMLKLDHLSQKLIIRIKTRS